MGGRGSGKTRAGAEFVRFAALFEGARRIALVKRIMAFPLAVIVVPPGSMEAAGIRFLAAVEDKNDVSTYVPYC